MLSRRLLAFGMLLIFPFFFIGGPSWQSARSLCEVWNLGHVLFFALFSLFVYFHLLPGHVSVPLRTCLALVVVVLLGIGIEVLQLGLGNRSVGWGDVVRDLAGAAIVFFWVVGNERKNRGQRLLMRMAVLAITLACLFPLGAALIDEYRARIQFPVLSGFEGRLELSRWTGAERMRLVADPVKVGHFAAELRLPAEKYSGISLFHFSGDWRGRKALAFSVFNPGVPVALHFRVHDRDHAGDRQQYRNRFNGTRILASGWNDIVIPMVDIRDAPSGRTMDLAHIRGFGIFLMDQPASLLYLDDVRLIEGDIE